ncbi:tyrosine-protein phosphatase [Nocardia sp. CA2R105]|uniref:tyrosine-protein phosphatase n=1 Tax=Nocardia coffeae TaxID=2873381 RepID=UPI001CA6B06F|nr:tyrosine-protein phosphatase [Nocardia coffeae]MBY8859442.1 tyrosine-protein phosphatase [Nocardia coffeae]
MSLIELQGAVNVRDLGGFVAAEGRRLTAGRLFRADALHKLTDGDVDVLAGLGLRTVVDFRSPREITGAGPDRLPAGVDRIELPIAGGNITATLGATVGEFSSGKPDLGGGRAAEVMRTINRQFITEPEYRAAFARTLHLIADPDRDPLLFHCTAGKDRTGWMAAIVLTALGVPHDDVLADYLATNDYVWPSYQAWITRGAESGEIEDPDAMRELLYQDPSYIGSAFTAVETTYGTFDRFLTDGLDFGPADLERLRNVLLE